MEKERLEFDGLIEALEEDYIELDLPDLITDHMMISTEGHPYIMFLTHTPHTMGVGETCQVCQKGTMVRSGKAAQRIIHDVPRQNKRIDIVYAPQRLKCNNCGATINVRPNGIIENRSMTERLLNYLKDECLMQRTSTLAQRCGLSTETISLILDQVIDEKNAEREKYPIEAPTVLGIDEKHFDHATHGVLINVETGMFIDLLPKNTRAVFMEAIHKLNNWDTNIKVVTMDMNGSYKTMVRDELPQAKVVIDKFHVTKDINTRTKSVRKRLVDYRSARIKAMKHSPEKEEQMKILGYAKNAYMFSYNLKKTVTSNSETDVQRKKELSAIISTFPEFELLYKIRYGLEEVYNATSYEDAATRYMQWLNFMPPYDEESYQMWCKNPWKYADPASTIPDANFPNDLFDAMRSFSSPAFQTNTEGILNYFLDGCRFTNAKTEHMNRTIAAANMAGFGYSFKHLRGKVLYAPDVKEKYSFVIKPKNIPSRWSTKDKNYFVTSLYRPLARYAFASYVEPRPNLLEQDDWINKILYLGWDDETDEDVTDDYIQVEPENLVWATFGAEEGDPLYREDDDLMLSLELEKQGISYKEYKSGKIQTNAADEELRRQNLLKEKAFRPDITDEQ